MRASTFGHTCLVTTVIALATWAGLSAAGEPESNDSVQDEENMGLAYDPVAAAQADISTLQVRPGDWPQWGGSRQRNNTPSSTGIPQFWDLGEIPRSHIRVGGRSEVNPDWTRLVTKPPGACNVKWVAALGSQTYGNPVVANGRIFIGTNNGAAYLDRYPAQVDLGVLLCLDERTGQFLWQHSSAKLPTGRVHDWPLQGVCSTPLVDGDRLWFVSNRCVVHCLDTEGFRDDENDGPFRDESVH